ncbi:hypothetical protein [Parvularcula lutaonensis]|uniref:Uncharacterized protein n=1 Tax=Parvularcula lutaonensis TaxID=491923 RepID=A0ABV7MDJ7_9PROT|nr:hypothetical protein [Parvularcula lutaonensis]GGY40010.1 hypothetical protein GCM10007148_05570 [Parvularcula lutaonensis]
MVTKGLLGLFNLGILPLVVVFLIAMFAPGIFDQLAAGGDTVVNLIGDLIPVEGAENASGELAGGSLVTLYLGVLLGRVAAFFRSRD